MAFLFLIPWFIVVSAFGFILETEFHNINASFDIVLIVEHLSRITLISNSTSVPKSMRVIRIASLFSLNFLCLYVKDVIHLTHPAPNP